MGMPKIRLFHIEVSNTCNFRCDFCPLTVSGRKLHSMPFSVYRNIVDQVAENGLSDTIMLHVLGEPLLYADVLNAVRYASNRQLKVIITTNGSLLNPDMIEALNDSGLYSMDISLQLFGNSRHRSRHAGLSFQDYYRTLLESVRVIQERTDIQLIIKMMNTVGGKLFSFERPMAFAQQGREFRGLVYRLIMDVYQGLGVDIHQKEIAGKLRKVNLNSAVRIRLAENLYVFVQLFMDWGNAFCERKVFPAKFGSCSFAFTTPAVLSDGSVVMCCADYDGHTTLGHIDEHPLAAILDSDRTRYLWEGFEKNRLRHPYCRRCLGSSNRLLAVGKGLGSILLSRFMSLQGDKRVVIR
jgi:sulfatase maturation enzyme AslB (radical SAM superfamily)